MAAFISSGAGHGRAHGGRPAAWAPRAGPRGIRIVRVGSLPSGYVKLCDIPRRCLGRFGSATGSGSGTKLLRGAVNSMCSEGNLGKSGGGRKGRFGAEPPRGAMPGKDGAESASPCSLCSARSHLGGCPRADEPDRKVKYYWCKFYLHGKDSRVSFSLAPSVKTTTAQVLIVLAKGSSRLRLSPRFSLRIDKATVPVLLFEAKSTGGATRASLAHLRDGPLPLAWAAFCRQHIIHDQSSTRCEQAGTHCSRN